MDILACIGKIQIYTAGMTYDQFKNDAKTTPSNLPQNPSNRILGEALQFPVVGLKAYE